MCAEVIEKAIKVLVEHDSETNIAVALNHDAFLDAMQRRRGEMDLLAAEGLLGCRCAGN